MSSSGIKFWHRAARSLCQSRWFKHLRNTCGGWERCQLCNHIRCWTIRLNTPTWQTVPRITPTPSTGSSQMGGMPFSTPCIKPETRSRLQTRQRRQNRVLGVIIRIKQSCQVRVGSERQYWYPAFSQNLEWDFITSLQQRNTTLSFPKPDTTKLQNCQQMLPVASKLSCNQLAQTTQTSWHRKWISAS